jgi:hypothetical protein
MFSSNIPALIDFRTGGITHIDNENFVADFNVLNINVLSLHIDTLFRTESGGKVNVSKLITAYDVVSLRTKSVQVFTTSNMTQYFYPTGYAIPQTVSQYGIYPLVTTNHVVPMHDDFQNVGAFRRRYNKVFTSKVYTNSLVIPLNNPITVGIMVVDPISILGQYVDTRLNVSFTDPVSKSNMVGWQFVATNYKPNPYAFLPNAPSRLYTPTRLMNFVAGPAAGEIVAKDVRCTNLYVKPPSASGSATVQVNGSISCQSLTVGGSNIGQVASVSTAHLMAAMSYLQASTVFKAILTKSTSSSQLNFKVRATLDDGLFNNGNANGLMAYLFVRSIRFKIVATSANVDSETTYLSRIQDMAESLTSGIQFYYSDVASGAAPHGTNLYITISPTIYASVNAVGIRHEIGPNRTAYRTNPTGTRIEVACPPLRVVTPSSWSEIRL